MPFGELLESSKSISVGVMYPGGEVKGGVPLVRVGDVDGNGIVGTPAMQISNEVHHEYRRTELRGDELLITLVGKPGVCVVVSPHMRGWNIARALASARLKDPNLRAYLKAVLESSVMRSIILSMLNTTVQPTLNLKEIKSLPVPIPHNLKIALEIGRATTLLNDRITLLRHTNTTLEAIAQTLFKSWFVDFDPVRARAEGREPDGMDAITAALFPDSFEDSPRGPIPRGWHASSLSDCMELNPQRVLRKGSLASYLDMASAPTQGHRPSGIAQRELGSGSKFINGDTLLAKITPCLENGKTAFVDFLADNEVGWGSTEFIVMRPKAPLSPFWGYLLARMPNFRAFAIQAMTGTSGRQRVDLGSLKQFSVVVPNVGVAKAFEKIIEPLRARIAAASSHADSLSELRDTLLPRLISGKLRLPETQTLIKEAIA
jgi:type I restriction enzyme, S subunit